MTTRKLSLGEVRVAHESVVEKMGADYLTPDVWYRDTQGRPLCAVGHIFAELNINISAIPYELNGQGLDSPYGEMIQSVLHVDFSRMVFTYLSDLQDLTDSGSTWGAALKELTT